MLILINVQTDEKSYLLRQIETLKLEPEDEEGINSPARTPSVSVGA